MLNPIPIIFVLVSMVGIIILIANHLPELREDAKLNPEPSWASGSAWKTIRSFVWGGVMSFAGAAGKTISRAKSEVMHPQDIARHLSDSVKTKLIRRREQVAQQEIVVENDEHEDDIDEAQNYFEQGNLTRAEELAIDLLKRDSGFKPAYELLGKIYTANKNWIEAAEVFRYLIKQVPTNEKYWASLGAALVGLEDYPEAIKAYRRSTDLYPHPEMFVALGLAHQALSDYASAGKALESALDIEPENTQVLLLLAQNFVHRDEPESAEHVLEQILELEPGNHIARERLMQLKS
jgi:tetratricopeptide (TPR) repeat protein